MAMQTVHTAFTFGFDQGKLGAIEAGVKKASGNLKNIAANTDQFRQKMGNALNRVKGLVGAYLGFRAVKAITLDYAKAADATAKLAAGLGISAQQYQRMNHAAALSGITTDELNMAIPKLAKSAGDAADGSKAMALAFRRANTDIKDQTGKIKDPITLLTDLADGLKGVEDKGRKTQILMNIFGRAGKKMGVLLDQGSEGIKKAMMEADKLGIVLSGKQLKAAENFNDEMLRVKSVFLGVRNMIAGRVLPVLTRQLRAFQLWWREGNNAERALRALKGIAFFAAIAMGRIITGMVIKQVAAFTKGVWALVRGLNAANLAATVTALKITAIFAAIGLVILIIEDLIGFAQGKDSLIGRILGPTSLAKDLREALLKAWRDIKEAWGEMKPQLVAAWEELKPHLKEIGRLIKPLIGPAFKIAIYAIITAIRSLSFWIQAGITQIRVLKTAYDTILGSIKSLAKWLGIDLAGAAAAASRAWKIGVAGILGALAPLIYAFKKAIALKNAVFGIVEKAETGAASSAVGIMDKLLPQTEKTSTGSPVMTGLFQPAPVAAFAGGGVGNRNINTTVSEGAVKMTVNATGDPQAIAAAVNRETIRGLNKVFTAASRDLVRPPSGQR